MVFKTLKICNNKVKEYKNNNSKVKVKTKIKLLEEAGYQIYS